MLYQELIFDESYPGFNPVQFGYEDCEPKHSFGPAVRTHWLLHYVSSGKGKFHYNGTVFDVSAGDVFVIPPYETTFYEADEKDPWHYNWIGFEAENLPIALPPVFHDDRMGKIFQEMKTCHPMGNGKSAFLSGKIWEMFGFLLQEKNQKKPSYVEQAIAHMDAEYMHEIRIEDLAKKLHLDRSYFCNLFKQETGISPQQYLVKTRLQKAAELMTILNQTPSTAAASTGYTDIYNFSKMFKKYYHVSPREYMKQYKETHE